MHLSKREMEQRDRPNERCCFARQCCEHDYAVKKARTTTSRPGFFRHDHVVVRGYQSSILDHLDAGLGVSALVRENGMRKGLGLKQQ